MCSDVEVPIEASKQTLKFRPLRDRVLVRPIVPKEAKSGDLYLPDTAVERPMEGVVVAVGRGRVLPSGEEIPVDVEVGQVVSFGKYSGNEVQVLGEKLLLLQEDELSGEYYSD